MFGVRKPYKGIKTVPSQVPPPEEKTKKKPKYFQK